MRSGSHSQSDTDLICNVTVGVLRTNEITRLLSRVLIRERVAICVQTVDVCRYQMEEYIRLMLLALPVYFFIEIDCDICFIHYLNCASFFSI